MILITGGAGFVGSHIAWALKDAGMQFTVLDDLSNGHVELLPLGCDFVRTDIADTSVVEDVVQSRKIRCIVHCAGLISVAESATDPLKYYDTNLSKTVALLKAATKAGIESFLFSSTATVYGDVEAETLSEALPVAPINPYASSKAMVEKLLSDVAQTGAINYGVLRYFNVAGADPQERSGQISRQSTHLIKIAAEAAVGKRSHVSVTGDDFATPDGTGVRDYIHVSDLADAHVVAISALLDGSGRSFTYNVGYGHGVSVLQALDCVDKVVGGEIPRVKAPRRPGDVARLVADNQKILRELGWKPRYSSLSTIIRHAVAWERKLHSS